jgi:hypothetical protein
MRPICSGQVLTSSGSLPHAGILGVSLLVLSFLVHPCFTSEKFVAVPAIAFGHIIAVETSSFRIVGR